ncbi:MAG: (2Fe-2S)-binding protein [Myxococcales bacterium]|nr:(2Fe-2S)-binding protein [Myxococcales bacterium]HIK86470.1 (2Fe-2S)-binding protein [Myxococcales bacterium]
MIVCECSGVTERQIRRIVREGACSTRDVARATGAGMSCGDCRSNVKKVVDGAIAKEFESGQSLQPTVVLTMATTVES